MSETLGREPVNELMAALAKAQGEMSNAPFDATNPHFKSKYATLASIRDATVPHLAKYGISIHQVTKLNGDGMVLATRLAHSSGQWIESVYPLPNSSKPHEMGSALTYARRYSWAAITGIAAEEDEDGNAAQEGAKNSNPPPKRTRAEISADANRKRQEVRDVEQDVLQIDSLAALDRYSREVLTPDFMASLGMKQWTVEQKVGERRRELEDWQKAAEKEPNEEDSAQLRDDLIEHIQHVNTETDLLVWRESPAFRSDLDSLPKPMQVAVRKAGAMKRETLRGAMRASLSVPPADAAMSRALIVVRSDVDRRRASQWCLKSPVGTRIGFQATKRSLPANDRLWAMLTEIAAQVPWHGVKLSAADYKLIFLDALKKELRIVPNLDGDGFVNLGRSSSDLSKEEFSDLLALIEAWGAKHHVQFNDPKEAAA